MIRSCWTVLLLRDPVETVAVSHIVSHRKTSEISTEKLRRNGPITTIPRKECMVLQRFAKVVEFA